MKDSSMISISTDATTDKSITEFAKAHEIYTKRVLNGRHPRSFPRSSELWQHYNASNTRLKSLRRGQRLWNIVQDEDFNGDRGGGDDCAGSELSSARTRTGDGHSADHPDNPSYKGTFSYTGRDDVITLKSLGVDMSESVPLHYGMIIIVINSSEEVVSVNEFNEVICKNLKDLTPQDYYLFKIIDLEDFTYPGPVEYGRPVWLQIYKDARPGGDKGVGQLLGTKINHSPDMGTHNFQDGKQNHAPISPQASSPPPKSVKSSPSANSAEPSVIVDGSDVPRSGESSRPQTPGGENKVVMEAAAVKPAAPSAASASTEVVTRSNAVQPEICGGLSVINILDGLSDAKEEVVTRQRMKHSFYLCQWIVRFAERNSSAKKRMLGDTTKSDDMVYVEQDLYCMASSVGSLYEEWPKRPYERHSEYFRIKADRMNQMKTEKGFDAFLDLVNEKGEGGEGQRSTTAIKNVTLDRKELRQLIKPPTTILPEDIHYGCVRRVAIKDPPAVTLVDRRCVWRMVPANNFGDTNLLSAKEKIAHKLLRTAEERLELSQRTREGGKVYESTTPKGKPLCGGENFSKMLRAITCQKRFDEETESLNDRRQQERLLLSHFEGLYEYSVGDVEKLRFPKVLGPPSPSRSKFSLHADQSLFMDSQAEMSNEAGLYQESASPNRAQIGAESSTTTLRGKSVEDYLNEDNTFGGNMLKLHRSLSEANSKIVMLAQPGRPNPFKPTVVQSNDVLAMSTSTGSNFPKLSKQHSSIGRMVGSLNRQGTFARGISSQNSSSSLNSGSPSRDAPVTTGMIMNQQEMASFNKKLDKLGEIDGIVESALRHRDRVEQYTRINTMFHSLAGGQHEKKGKGGRASMKTSASAPSIPTSEMYLIAGNFNMEGYDPKRGI